jgi:hypothetical protein
MVQIKGRDILVGDIRRIDFLDTSKLKVEFKEYEPLEPFVTFLDPAAGREVMVRVDKPTVAALAGLGMNVHFPGGKVAGKK